MARSKKNPDEMVKVTISYTEKKYITVLMPRSEAQYPDGRHIQAVVEFDADYTELGSGLLSDVTIDDVEVEKYNG